MDFRRECFSHSLSLLMSAFSLPMPPGPLRTLHRLTERSATGQMPEQADDRKDPSRPAQSDSPDSLATSCVTSCTRLANVSQVAPSTYRRSHAHIETVHASHRRSNSHAQKPFELSAGDCFSHCLSLLMSALLTCRCSPAILADHLHRPTERSATASEDRRRTTDDGSSSPLHQALQHPNNRLILISPALPCRLVDAIQVQGITHPHPHLVSRTNRHLQKAFELRFRAFLASVVCLLSSDTHSFGVWL